jgi:hypothetical protein
MRIIGRICKDGSCPARAMVVRTTRGYEIVDRVAAVAAKDSVAGEVAAQVYNELAAPEAIRSRTAYITTGRRAAWKRADALKVTIDDYVARKLKEGKR